MVGKTSQGIDVSVPSRQGVAKEFAEVTDGGTVRRVIGSVVVFVTGVNAAAITGLWLHGGGVTAVHGLGDLLTSLGRITGLLSAFLALIQVLLLARLPFLERLTGFDHLTVWHRLNGKACLYLVLAHVVLITIGYSLNDRISITHEASVLLSSYPGMVTATFGTVLFVLVVATSLVIVYRRMRYETWYFVHLTIYAAIALAWFHQIPTGNEFATSPMAAAYWRSLYVGTIALLVLFRLVLPIAYAVLYRMRVAEVVVESPTVVSLRMTGHHLDRLGARPGQFFLWRFITRDRWWESHPFSLSAVPDGRSLRITVKSSGDFTGHMKTIRPGTFVMAEGPFGVFTSRVRRRPSVALIAGGIGISPIRALVEEMAGDVALIYRVVQPEDIVFRHELDQLARERGITLRYVVGDHASEEGKHLMSPEHLKELIPDIVRRDVYVCGPPVMSRLIERNVRAAGVPAKYIHSERFALSS